MSNPYQAPVGNSAAPQQSIAPGWFVSAMSISAIAMTVVSLVLAGWSVETEPFYGPISLRQAVISLVGGGIGMLFWIAWAGGIGYAVLRRWVPVWAVLLLLLAIIGLTLNAMVTFDYLGDRHDWANP